MLRKEDVGYYTSADQPREEPEYKPEFPGPCPICGEPMTEDDVRTYSVMPLEGSQARAISLFYRTHRTCANASDESVIQALDSAAMTFGSEAV